MSSEAPEAPAQETAGQEAAAQETAAQETDAPAEAPASTASASGQPVRRLRVLFSVRPYHGHLHPLIPVARAFRRAGHHVAFATAEDMAPTITGAVLPWLPAGLNPRQLWDEFPDSDPDYGYEPIAAKLSDLLEIAVEQFAPDVIIREPTDLAAALAAELTGAVHALYGLGHFIPRESWHILKADKTLARLRREYGMPADPELNHLYDGLYLSVLPRAFEGRRHGVPNSAVQRMRYTPWDGDAKAVPPLPAGESSRPTVLMTLGTVYNYYSDMFARFLEALGTEPVNVICTLGAGSDDAVLENAPSNVRFERYIPHSSILPNCQAMLCHAGFNTTMGCLSAGVPMVCVPLGSDQEYNARSVAADGMGLCLMDDEATVEAVRAAVRRVLTEPSFTEKTVAFQRDMNRRPGIPAAIRRIEAMAAVRPAHTRLGSRLKA